MGRGPGSHSVALAAVRSFLTWARLHGEHAGWLARRSAGRLGRAGVRRVAGTDVAGGEVDGALDSALLHSVETANGLAIESDPALLLFHDVSPLRRACVGCSWRLSTYRGEGRASQGDTPPPRRRPADAPRRGRSAAAAGPLAASGARRVVCAPEVHGGRRGLKSRSRERPRIGEHLGNAHAARRAEIKDLVPGKIDAAEIIPGGESAASWAARCAPTSSAAG
jgi:hypothetical protein